MPRQSLWSFYEDAFNAIAAILYMYYCLDATVKTIDLAAREIVLYSRLAIAIII